MSTWGRCCQQSRFKGNADEHSVRLTLTLSLLPNDTDALCPWLPLTSNIVISHLHAEQSARSSLQGPPSCHASLRLHTWARKTPGGSDWNLCPWQNDKLESICRNRKKMSTAEHKWLKLDNWNTSNVSANIHCASRCLFTRSKVCLLYQSQKANVQIYNNNAKVLIPFELLTFCHITTTNVIIFYWNLCERPTQSGLQLWCS